MPAVLPVLAIIASAASVVGPVESAAEHLAAGEYAQAAEDFAQAYAETQDPTYLYSQAMSLRRAGSCRAAIEVFEAFIASNPDPADAQAASEQIEECRGLLSEPEPKAERTDAEKASPPPPAVDPPAEADPAPSTGVSTSSSVDRLGLGLSIGGSVLLLSGAGLVGGAHGLAARDVTMEAESTYAARGRTIDGLHVSGIVLSSVGAAVLVGGIVRLVRQRDRGRGGLAWTF